MNKKNTVIITGASRGMGRVWFRHNIEEVGNFEFFLPGLHANDS